MIATNSIPAKFEDGHIVMIAPEKTKLQNVMLAYTEKLNVLVDYNEKLMDAKLGTDENRRKQRVERK